MRPRPRTIASETVRRAGLGKGYLVLLFIAQWGYVEAKQGRRIERVEEYAEWWELSRSQAFRQQDRFRKCWPEYATPRELLEVAGVDLASVQSADEAAEVLSSFPLAVGL